MDATTNAATRDALADIYAFLLARRAKRLAAQPPAGAQPGIWGDAAGQCPAVPRATAGQESAPAGESGRGEEGEGHRQCPSTPEV